MDPTNPRQEHSFSDEVTKQEQRKLKALRENKSVWFGLGMMGMIGWSVAVPSLLGATLGIWLDKTFSQPFSWTLTGLLAGVATGGIIAWYWILKEDKEMHKNNEPHE